MNNNMINNNENNDNNIIMNNDVGIETFNINNEPVNKKKKIHPIAIVLIIIIVALLLFLGIISFAVNRPKTIYDSLIDKMYKYSTNLTDGLIDNNIFDYKNQIIEKKGTFKVTANIKSSYVDKTTKKMLNDLKNYDVNYKNQIDLKNKKIYLELGLDKNKNNLISVESFLQNDKIYFYIPDVTDNPLYYEIDNEMFYDVLDKGLENISLDNYEYLTSKIKQYIKESIKKEYLSKKSGTYVVDKKKLKGIKNTLVLNEDNLKEMLKNILLSLSKDDKFVDIISKSINYSKKKIISSLQLYSNKLDFSSEDINIKINIYTNVFGKYLGADITSNENVVSTSIKNDEENTIKVYSYYDEYNIYDDYNTNEKVKATLKSKLLYVIKINEKEKTISFTYNLSDSDGFNVILAKTKDGIKLNLDSTYFNAELSYLNSVKDKVVNDEYNVSISAIETVDVDASIKSETKEITKMDSFDLNNSKNIQDVTLDELNIYSNKVNAIFKETVFKKYVKSSLKSMIKSKEKEDFYNDTLSLISQIEDKYSNKINEDIPIIVDVEKDITGVLGYKGYIYAYEDSDDIEYVVFIHNDKYMYLDEKYNEDDEWLLYSITKYNEYSFSDYDSMQEICDDNYNFDYFYDAYGNLITQTSSYYSNYFDEE